MCRFELLGYPRHQFRRCGVIAAALLFIVCHAGVTKAQYDTFRTIGRRVDSLVVNTTFEMSANQAVSVAQIDISNPTRLSPRDRDLVVVLYVQPRTGKDGIAFRKRVLLAEGQRSVTVKIPHAFMAYQSSWDVGVFEAGRDIEDKRNRNNRQLHYNWTNSNSSTAASYAVIAGSNDDKALLTKASRSLPNAQTGQLQTTINGWAGNSTTTYVPGIGSTEIVAVSELPADWRAYMSRVAWYLSVDTLKELASTFTGSAEALKKFVASGGSVVVFEVDTAEEFEQVNGFFSTDGNLRLGGWQKLTKPATLSSLITLREGMTADDYVKELTENGAFLRHSFIAGSVSIASLSLDDMDQWHEEGTRLALVDTTQAYKAYHADGNWFWRNLISSVGKPPVWMFCLIVALFSAILGPGLLMFTGRMQRRSLMIFLVPLISLLSTVAIVTYGILHEGFGSYTRVTSVSFIDPEQKMGFSWSRQNYFSGLPPRGGLDIPNDVFARPVASEQEESYGFADPRRNVRTRVEIGENSHRWVNWLKARQQQQMLIGNPLESPTAPVTFRRVEEGLEAENVSGYDLPFFVARGASDDYYYHAELAAGEKVLLEVQSRADVSSRVGSAMVDLRPRPPAEMEDGGTIMDFGVGRQRTSSSNNSTAGEVINGTLARYLSSQLQMEPFSYATIVPENKEIFVPLEGKQDESLHVIVGTQTW